VVVRGLSDDEATGAKVVVWADLAMDASFLGRNLLGAAIAREGHGLSWL
jgi:hypothetical protein